MFEPRLLTALAAGSTAVTPNNRLARALVAAYDRQQRANGRRAWRAARAMPWSAWLEQLWSDVVAYDALPSLTRLVRGPQARWLWREIVARDSGALADVRGAAALAADAWALLKTWGSGGESWRGWRNDPLAGDDCAVFAGWAERFNAALGEMRAVDSASLADVLARTCDAIDAWRNIDVVLAGFIEPTSQQERLLGALTQRGARIARCDTIADGLVERACTSAESPDDELLLALTWARDEALANPAGTIGIAVEDLPSRRDQAIALAEDVLCPSLQLPGREEDVRPYNISLGASLASTPLAAAALGWIELAVRPLPVAEAAVLLRSPYLPDAAALWPRRASIERTWLDVGRREIGCSDAANALDSVDKALAARMRRVLVTNRFPNEALPGVWVKLWRDWLYALGWPGDRVLTSAEQQTREAFDDLLASFAAISIIDQRMRASDAVNALRDLADDTLFQPESPAVPIQIVGLLEAAGLPFDRLWIAGLAADRWPPAPQPQPLLPLKWQRDHDVPRSSAVRELRFARKTTTLLLRGAPRVVVSHARTTGDEPRRASQLIAELDLPQFAPISPQPRYAHAIHASAPSLDVTADHHAPPVLEGQRLRGGARIVEAQGNCPFQAVAAFRLNADQWPEPEIGLTQMERGTLVHASLAAFWRDVKTSAELSVLDESELDDRIASAVESARFELTQERWRSVPKVIATAETRRIAALLRMWIIAHDRVRPPFAVDAIETRIDLSLAGLIFQLKVDRIDRVGDDAIIIDYKTGGTTSPKGWFDVRPRAPQLGMYALAYAQSGHDAAVRAVAYGQVRSGALKVNGVAADAAAWPALIPVSTINPAIADWPAFEAWWQTHLTALAQELRDGVAHVAPRDGAKTCRTCGMAALCRIGAAAIGHDDGGND